MAKSFNRPAGGQSGGMLQQIQRLQEQMAQAQERLAQETVTATSGGGVVTVVMSGDQHCRSVILDPTLIKEAATEMLQDLVLTAFNLALEKSRELQGQVMGPLASGLPF